MTRFATEIAEFPGFTAEQVLTDTGVLLKLLDAWAERGWLRYLDAAFARALANVPTIDPIEPLALLAAALVSHQAGRGHLLLDLDKTLDDPDAMISITGSIQSVESLPKAGELLINIDTATWQTILKGWPRVGDGKDPTPLVLIEGALYLRRFWQGERDITRLIEDRLKKPFNIEPNRLRAQLDPLFPEHTRPGAGITHWQKIACAVAVRCRFAVITGGPGTGKTTTVIRLLALLQIIATAPDENGEGGRPHRILLAAPTGKAAARLKESIADQVDELDLSHLKDAQALKAAIPHDVSTLHRMLGGTVGTRRFRFNAERPLPADVVVVDEASMIDAELMLALVEALPDTARLVLIGDKDQLASVEAGAILGSLCARTNKGGYDARTHQWLESATGESIDKTTIAELPRTLEQSIAMLRYSHRFGPDSGIGELARAINTGDGGTPENLEAPMSDAERGTTPTVYQILVHGGHQDLHHLKLEGADDPELARLAVAGISDELPGHGRWVARIAEERPDEHADAKSYGCWAKSLCRERETFQLLTPLQRGPWGVSGLNARIEIELAARGLLQIDAEAPHPWYEGRPVLVTANDYVLGLMNGDVGITLRVPVRPDSPDGNMTLRIAFPNEDSESGVRWVLPSRLSGCQTVFAMTVHKSQGSEFDHTALVLPDRWNPMLTRELIYTAVTRAKVHFSLACPDFSVLSEAVNAQIARASRLFF